MKTLDEVIKAVHHCGLLTGFDDTYEYDGGCPYEDCSKCEQKRMLGKDIIHYLAAYKDDKNELTALRAFWKEQQANAPLTWDELRTMEGKPVWVEHKHYSKWLIVYEVYENTIVLDGNGFYTQYFSDDNNEEVRWKAYRKER